jgi:hypothetical protein
MDSYRGLVTPGSAIEPMNLLGRRCLTNTASIGFQQSQCHSVSLGVNYRKKERVQPDVH